MKVTEYHVKAAFIYKFATYIQWPSRTGIDTNTPFVIGVIGRDPFGPALDAVVRGQSIQGRPILVRKLRDLDDVLRCDLIFISTSERDNLHQILERLRGSPVLTIGDMHEFAELGGMINLVTTEDNKIRFDINKGAVDRAGLKAPSELLRLAHIVESRSDGGKS